MKLIQYLEEKQHEVSHEDLFNLYKSFEKEVKPQLDYTLRLFEEYTPHNNEIHIRNLHRIAEIILPEKIFKTLNLTETFILSCAIIGHDWGMAIPLSEQEKVKSLLTLNTDFNNSNLLKDERQHLEFFISKNSGLLFDSLDFWREYFRYTHQERAKHRILNFFEPIDRTLGRIIGEVCAGHGLDIEDIESYDENESVCGQIVNSKCLAVYIRMIDLLDIAKDRTPYKLWKFLNPVNGFSNAEFKKHLALNPISRSLDQVNTIHIHGETGDADVYYSLKDLRKYVDNQILENLRAIENQGDYSIWFKVDWKIKSIGFEPVDIKFEFDRKNVLEILSSQIYDDDPLVFLRELIQNAIDATYLKEAFLKKNDQELKNKSIHINISKSQNGKDTITVEDYGIGMDEGIIRNYLSKVGKSYFNSREFEELGLKLDNISKFGIGILSCYTVSDQVDIRTTRLNSDVEYNLKILDFNNFFKVSKTKVSSEKSGTLVKVYVDALKWKKRKYENFRDLDYLKYITHISYLKDIDIKVNIDDKEYIIKGFLNKVPEISNGANVLKHTYPEEYYSNNKNVPQELYRYDYLDFEEKDELLTYTGTIINPTPRDPYKIFRLENPGNNKTGVRNSNLPGDIGYFFKWNNENKEPQGDFPSAASYKYYEVYFKGILVPTIILKLSTPRLSSPMSVKVNLIPHSDNKSIISVNRTNLDLKEETIEKRVKSILNRVVFKEYSKNIFENNSLKEYLIKLSLICDKVDLREIIEQNLITLQDLPVIFLDEQGYLLIKKVRDLDINKTYLEIPKGMSNKKIYSHFINQEWSEEPKVKVKIPLIGANFNYIIPYAYISYPNNQFHPEILSLIHNLISTIYHLVFGKMEYHFFQNTLQNYILTYKYSIASNKTGEMDDVIRKHHESFIAVSLKGKLVEKDLIFFFRESMGHRQEFIISKVFLNTNKLEFADNLVLLYNRHLENIEEESELKRIFENFKFFNFLYPDEQTAKGYFINKFTNLIRSLSEKEYINPKFRHFNINSFSVGFSEDQ